MITNELNELSRSQLTRIIISYLGIKSKKPIYPSTKEVMVHCPFHKDKTPSCGIDIENGRWNCFSCGRGGNIESLYKELTGDNIYKVLGIKNDPFSNFSRKSLYNYNYTFNEPSKKSVYLNYDSSKLIPAVESKEGLAYLLKRGIKVSVAEELGFLYAEDTSINTTRFYHRLCIPVYEKGVLSSIEGRKIFSNDYGPKVLYPKNTSVDMLFDIDNLNKEDTVYACEGLMDLCILRGNSNFKNSTSIFGANITNRQLSQIKEFKSFIYIPDNDNAGNETVNNLRKSGLDNLYILKLPESYNGQPIKDIGDLPKVGLSIDGLLNKKWLSYIKKLTN